MSTEKKSPALTAIVLGVLLAGAAVVLAGTSCKTIEGKAPAVAEAGHIVADCAKAEVSEQASHVLDDVASALVTTDYSAGLRGVATDVANRLMVAGQERAVDFAWQTVKCAVAELFDQSKTHLGYAGGLDEPTAARERLVRDNARAWLDAH